MICAGIRAGPGTADPSAPGPAAGPPLQSRSDRRPGSAAAESSAASAARSAARSLSRPHSRSASPRELANTIVDRCASIRSSTRASTCGQMECCRAGSPAGGRPPSPSAFPRPRPSAGRPCPPPGRRSAGRAASRWAARRSVTGSAPPRNVATSSGGRTVADSPIRWRLAATGACPPRPACPGPVYPESVRRGRGHRGCAVIRSASSRSSDSARCAPRLPPASACTSSTMTVCDPAQRLPRLRGQQQEQRLRGRDQDVGRLAGHLAALVGGGVAGPHRRP